MKELIDEPNRLEDLPEEFRINRYSFRFDTDNNSFSITEEKTKSSTMLIAAFLFGSFSLIFIWSFYDMVSKDGMTSDAYIPLFFACFMLSLVLIAIYTGYVRKSVYSFYSDELIVKGGFGRLKRLSKQDFESVYIKKTLTQNQFGSTTDYAFSIHLKRKTAFGRSTENGLQLFHLDEKNGVASVFGQIDYTGMSKVEAEAIRIGKVIEVYWDIPFAV